MPPRAIFCLPDYGFDPTEASIPFVYLSEKGCECYVATELGMLLSGLVQQSWTLILWLSLHIVQRKDASLRLAYDGRLDWKGSCEFPASQQTGVVSDVSLIRICDMVLGGKNACEGGLRQAHCLRNIQEPTVVDRPTILSDVLRHTYTAWGA